MPELPEVEVMGRAMRRWTTGRTLRAFEVLDPKVLVRDQGDGSGLGAPVREVSRRGKYLALIAGREAWVLHFRMTGQVVRALDGRRARARWVLDQGEVAFVDPRRFGTIARILAADLPDFYAAIPLGPEPWPGPRPGAWWAERYEGARGPLKPALLLQDRVAGLGNIAGSEICWRAGLRPDRAVGSLTEADWDRLAIEATAFLDQTVAQEDGDEIQYVNLGGDNPFQVYQRDGSPCPRCGAALVRTVQAGRATFFCGGCQG